MRGPHLLRVHLFGGLEVEDVPVLALGSRKGRAVLRRLAVAAGAVVPVDDLLDVAWPEGAPVRAADQLSVLVSRLRSALGTERVVRRDAGYALACDWLDVRVLDSAASEVTAALASGGAADALARGRAALQVVRGELLPEEQADTPWLDEARTAARRALDQLRLVTAEAALAAGAARECADLARGCLDAEPYDESALRLLMRASVATGQVSSALAAYQAVVDRLADELGVDPSPETRAVHLELLRRTTEPPPETPAPAQVAGREGLLATLVARLGTVASQGPALTLVTGPAGMGKTTLLNQLASRAVGPAQVLRTRGDVAGGGLPLQPVLDALSVLLAERDDAPDLLGADAAVLAPLLGRPGSGPPTAAAQALVSGTNRTSLAAALGGLLERLSTGSPLLLLVDDADLLDPASVALLHHLTRPASRLPLLVVATARPGQGPPWRAGSVHELAPLSREDVARLVGDDKAEALWNRSAGHPLFLVELARWEGELPESVLTAVAQRCTRSDDLGGVLRAGAVLGGEIDVDLLAGVLGTGVGALLDHLDDGVHQGLLRATTGGYAFAHDLYREALACLVTPARARVLHREAARLLARRTGVDPGRLGHHALAGGDDALAAGALAAAAEVATARYEHEQALGLLDRAVALAPTPARRLQRARALLLTGRYDDAEREAQQADSEQTRAATGPMRAIAAVWLSMTLSTRGDAVLAYAVVTSPDTGAARTQPLVEPHRCLALGRALALLGRGAEAVAVFDQLAATVEQQHVRRFAGRAENYRGWVLRNLGATAEADDATQAAWEAVQSLEEVSAAEARGHAILDLADAALRRGDLDAATTWLDRATRAELAPHVMKWRFDLRRDLSLGRLALVTGDVEGALGHATDVRTRAEGIGVARFTVQADLLTARARHHAGMPVDLDRVVASAAALSEVAPLESWWLLAELARDLDQPRFARTATDRVDALLPGAGPWADTLKAAARQSLAGLPA